MKNLDKILLRVEPSLFNDELVDMRLNLFILDVVSVHEVETNNDHNALNDA